MIRKSDYTSASEIGFRHLWGSDKPKALLDTAHSAPPTLYDSVTPVLGLGLPFGPTAVSPNWFAWPALPDLFPARFHGVLAVLHDPAYRKANAGALGLGWPRIPLPAWPGSAVADDRAHEPPPTHADEASDDARAAEALAASAGLGRELARLLNPETPVPRRHARTTAAGAGRHRRADHNRRNLHDG